MANGAPTVSNGLVISGVTTSTSFSGDGSALTGITQTTINNNGSNRIITGSGTANTLEGESTFTYDGVNKAKIDTSQTYATLQLDGSSGGAIEFYDDATRKFEIYGIDAGIEIYDREKGAYHSKFLSGGDLEVSDGKVHIKSSGEILRLETTASGGGQCYIDFDDETATRASIGMRGSSSDTLTLAALNGSMRFDVQNKTQALNIDSSGNVLIGRTAGQKPLSVRKVDNSSGVHIVQTIGGNNHVSGYAVGLGFDPEGYEARTKIAIVAEGTGSGYSRGKLHFLLDEANDSGEATLSQSRMTITDAGTVTKPSQPSFAAFASAGGYGLNNQIFPLGSVRHNIGSHYNTSNYRFTAPVAGRYLFTFYSILNTQINSGYYEIRVNNSSGNGQSIHFTTTNSSWDHVSSSHILNLNTNDYVTMWSNSNIGWHGGSWQLFCGELLS